MPRWLANWLGKPQLSAQIGQFEADLDARLAARKSRRAQRSQAAIKGWQTRKAVR